MLSNRVRTGPFAGKTKAELQALLTDAQSQLAAGGASLTGASVNGQSLQLTPGPTVLSRIKLLQAALAQVDATFVPPSHTLAVRFGPGCG